MWKEIFGYTDYLQKNEFQYAIFSDDNVDMSIIDTNIGFVADCQGIATYPTVFCIRKNYKLMTQFIFEDNSHTWSAQQIAFSSAEMAYAYPAYSSEIILLDENDIPVPQHSLWLWSKDAARVAINGNICYLNGSNKKVKVETNSYGKLNVIQETELLAVPDLFVSFSPDVNEDCVQIKQYEVVRDKFNSITKEQLYEAQKHDGTHLLEDEYRTTETVESLSNAIHQCMSIVPQENSMGTKGFCMLKPNEWKCANLLKTDGPDFCWSIERNGNNLVYRTYQSYEKEAVINQMRANALGWNPFKFIGDIVKAAAKKVIDVVKLVVSKVGNLIKAAVNFIMDGVKHFAECVINTVQEVFHTVETFFQEVKVAFRDLFQWLGFIFDWEDILRTKRAIAYLTDESINLLHGISDFAFKQIDLMMKSIIGEVEQAIDSLIAKLDPNVSLGNCINGKAYGGQLTPEQEECFENNIIMNRFIDTDLEALSLQIDDCFSAKAYVKRKNVDDLISLLSEYIVSIKENKSFQHAVEYFENMLKGKGNIFTNAICGILELVKGLSVLVLQGVTTLVKGLFELFSSLINALKDILNTEIELPFLSSLYEKITHDKLTLKEIPCLLISIPLTILCKLMDGKAPFSDDSSLEKFKQESNAQMIINSLNAYGINCLNKINISKKTKSFLKIAGAVSAAFYYVGSTFGDADFDGASPMCITIFAFVSEMFWDISSAFILFSDEYNGVDIANFIIIASGLLFDGCSIVIAKTMPENAVNEILKWVTFAYGIISLCSVIASIIEGKSPSNTAGIIASVCTPVVIMSKIGLINIIKISTNEMSPKVVLAIDFVAALGIPTGLLFSYTQTELICEKMQIYNH